MLSLRTITAVFLLGCSTPVVADTTIPDTEITSLKEDLTRQKHGRKSVTSRRRAFKNIIRDAESLIKASPAAPNRFEVLAVILDIKLQQL